MITLRFISNFANFFKKSIVFHLGTNAGFFSEYNNMLLAYIYSLDKDLNFRIYSKDANFSFKDGLNDYFIPFFNESNWKYHEEINYRSIYEFNYFKNKKLVTKTKILKFISKTNFLTYEIFENIRSQTFLNKTFYLKGFANKNDLKSIFTEVINKTWVYNASTKFLTLNLTSNLKLPESYVGIHIRGGDKKNEHKLFSISDYITKVKSLTNIVNLFIATDDYNNIEQIRINYPEYNCYYLCSEDKKGYDQKLFEKQNKSIIKSEMIELFATVEILNKAEYFIGTYSSNIGTFVSSRRNYKNSFALDFEEWRVW